VGTNLTEETIKMSVEKAEAVVAQLEQKRSACVRHGTELQDERANVALSAHTGDAKARKRLDEINSEIAVHSSELASLDAALGAASERLEKARQHEAQKADRQRATALRQELVAFREHGRALKVAFDAIALHGNGLWQTHTRSATRRHWRPSTHGGLRSNAMATSL
jgi:chromosome segregation ATPase